MKEIVVGISGASGMIYATRLLRALAGKARVELVVSDVAESILKHEVDWDFKKESFSDYCSRMYDEKIDLDYSSHKPDNFYAKIASGSVYSDGMVISPCSMKTLSGVAHGSSRNLTERAADVTLKERRPLVLVVRELPFNRVHLENMLKAHDAGATILPASPAYYLNQKTIYEVVDFVVGRTLNCLDIDHDLFKPWGS